jgi:predicted site-specific integrase-resolvase
MIDRNGEDAVQRLMTPRQLAKLLGVEVNTLAKWRSSGTGPEFLKYGSAVRYDERDIARFINDSRRRSTADSTAS